MIPEYQGCPPRVVRGAAFHAATTSSVNQTVRLPRWRKAASYAAEFVTLCLCFGMWRRRSWFSLKGKVGTRRIGGRTSYLRRPSVQCHRPDPCNSAAVMAHVRERFLAPPRTPAAAAARATTEESVPC